MRANWIAGPLIALFLTGLVSSAHALSEQDLAKVEPLLGTRATRFSGSQNAQASQCTMEFRILHHDVAGGRLFFVTTQLSAMAVSTPPLSVGARVRFEEIQSLEPPSAKTLMPLVDLQSSAGASMSEFEHKLPVPFTDSVLVNYDLKPDAGLARFVEMLEDRSARLLVKLTATSAPIIVPVDMTVSTPIGGSPLSPEPRAKDSRTLLQFVDCFTRLVSGETAPK